MLSEDYVSYETAKLLKKKGFDEATIGYYYTISEIPEKIKFFDSPISIYDSEGLIGCIQAPTLQMAMKWLRERHILVLPEPKSFTLDGEVATWVYNIWCGDNCEVNADFFDGEPFDNYEEACEDGIKYCLENLI